MDYITFALRNWGWFYLPRFLVSLLHIIAFALFAEFLSNLLEVGFSYKESIATLIFVFIVFSSAPLANLVIGLLMRMKVAKAVEKSLGNNLIYLHNDPSILGRSVIAVCQFCDLPLVFLEIPITFVIFCFLQRSNFICFAASILVSIFPLFISFLLAKNKIANASRMFESQNQRSAIFGGWLKNQKGMSSFKNIFKEELRVRKMESFLDESGNILPHSIILIILIFLFWTRVLVLREIVIVYITSTLFIGNVTEFYTSIGHLVRVNKFYQSLEEKK